MNILPRTSSPNTDSSTAKNSFEAKVPSPKVKKIMAVPPLPDKASSHDTLSSSSGTLTRDSASSASNTSVASSTSSASTRESFVSYVGDNFANETREHQQLSASSDVSKTLPGKPHQRVHASISDSQLNSPSSRATRTSQSVSHAASFSGGPSPRLSNGPPPIPPKKQRTQSESSSAAGGAARSNTSSSSRDVNKPPPRVPRNERHSPTVVKPPRSLPTISDAEKR